MATPSTPQLVDRLTIHKVDNYNTWKTQYGTNIGDDDLVIVPPTYLMPRPVVNNVVTNGVAGQFLQTDGQGGVIWSSVSAVPVQNSTTNGKFLKSSSTQGGGYEAIWDDLPLDTFCCEYGVTTFSEIEAAFGAKKLIFVQPTTNSSAPNYNATIAGSIFILDTRYASDDFVFHCVTPWRSGDTETTTSIRCTAQYNLVSNPTGNPSAQGWYVLASTGAYVLSTDTSVVSGVLYYTKTSSTEWSILRLNFGGGQTVYYGFCGSASSTSTKTVTINQLTGTLQSGMMFRVVFSAANSAQNPYLKINDNTAHPIQKTAGSMPGSCSWKSGEVLDFLFYNNNFILINGSVAGERDIAGGIATLDSYGKVTSSQTTAYTMTVSSSRDLSANDNGRRLKVTTGNIILSIPTGLDANFEVEIVNCADSGTVKIAPKSGISLNGVQGANDGSVYQTLSNKYDVAALAALTSTEWLIKGDAE